MSTPRVCVLTATYGAAEFIDRTIACVLSQTFTDFEWVVVDDESPDDTPDRIAAIDDPRVNLIRRPNGGPSAARNTGLARARSEMVALLDHDDVWFPERLARLVAMLDDDPSLGFVSSNMLIGDPDAPAGAHTILDNPDCLGLGLDDARTWLRGCSFSPSTALARRSLFDRHGGWDERLWYAQDWELVLRFWLRGERAAMVPEPLGWTVMRPGQLSSASDGTWGDRETVLRELLAREPDHAEAVAGQLTAWERDEALRNLGIAMRLWRTDPRGARRAARWAVRRPIPPADRALAGLYAVSPYAAGMLRRGLWRDRGQG